MVADNKMVGPQINPADLKDRVCSCGGRIFADALSLKELPALLSPSGLTETMMYKIGFVCVKCGLMMPLRPAAPKKPTIEVVKS